MKKIMIITNHSYMLWRFRKELIERLMIDHEVVLVMPFVGHEDDFKALGLRCIEVDVDRRSINPAKDLRLMNTYKQLLKEEKPDLLLTYSIKPNIYGGLAAQSLGIPYFSHVQGLGTAFQKKGIREVVTSLYKKALKRAKRVFFENEENARQFVDSKIIPAQKVAVMKGAGINLDNYPPVPYPQNDAVHFLYLGRIMKEKGVGELFDAMERLHETYGDRVVLDLVGFFEDEYKDRVEGLCEKGVAVFHGFQEDPHPYYAATDCVVLASYHEGMSNVLLEGSATARPIITSNIPGCREAVDDTETGWLCEAQDTETLYRALCLAVEAGTRTRAEMGLAARQKMEAEFSRADVVSATIRILLS